jgi:hypothetical protein
MSHIILDDEVANTVLDLLTEFNLQEANITEVDNGADGNGLNAEDDTVLAELTKYNYAIEPDGMFPGDVVLGNLDSVAYDPDSSYAKRTNSKKESYFSKFHVK